MTQADLLCFSRLTMKQIGSPIKGYNSVRDEIITLLDQAKSTSVRAVNVVMTAVYWSVGRRIVEFEQHGASRAKYGGALLPKLSEDLNSRFKRGFSVDNLETMRLFYLAYSEKQISETVSRNLDFVVLAKRFPLPWSHYVLLLRRVKETSRLGFFHIFFLWLSLHVKMPFLWFDDFSH